MLFIISLFCGCHANNGTTPLMQAAKSGNMQQLQKLVGHSWIEKPDNQGKTALTYAIEGDQLTAVKYLVAHGANVNLRNSFNGTSTLMYAAAAGHTDIAKYLISQGTLVYFRNLNNESALIAAAGSGSTELAMLLLQHGAHFNRCTKAGLNAYMTARHENKNDTAKHLAQYAAQHHLKLKACEAQRFK